MLPGASRTCRNQYFIGVHIYARHGILTHAPGFVSSFAGLHGSPRAGSYGPVTRSPYHGPLLIAGTKPCQTPPSNPGSGSRISAPPSTSGDHQRPQNRCFSCKSPNSGSLLLPSILLSYRPHSNFGYDRTRDRLQRTTTLDGPILLT